MNYPQLPGLTPDGRLYQNADMGTVEAFLPSGGYPTAHAPAMLELPDGAMLCCWFAGTYEGSADIRIICSRLEKDGLRWSDPVDISGDPERSEQNPSLFAGNDGAVWAIYTAQKDRQAGKDNMQFTSQIRVQKSTDGGKTWGPYETLFAREGSFCRQPIQVLSNGRWIFANWLCTDSPDGLSGDPTALQISDDEGRTWRQVDMPGSRGRVHANVVELENGHLAAFMRSREADFIYRSESSDWGDTGPDAAAQQQLLHQRAEAAERARGHCLQPHLHARPAARQGCLARTALPGGRSPERGRRPDLPADPLDGARRGLRGRGKQDQQPPVRVPLPDAEQGRHAASGLRGLYAQGRQICPLQRGRRDRQEAREGWPL